MNQTKSVTGKFVHVVAKVDLAKRSGEILYVNPATKGLQAPVDGDPAITLRFKSVDGTDIMSVNPVLHMASCERGIAQHSALIQQDVPVAENMAGIDLVIDGKVVNSFSTHAPAPSSMAETSGLLTEKLSGVSPLAGPKFTVNAKAHADVDLPGVTYTVQAKPSASSAWSTLAVSSKSPKVTVDANQFPGRSSVIVRVLKTNGFSEEVIAEDTVKF